MYLITPLVFIVLLALTSAKSVHGEHEKPSRSGEKELAIPERLSKIEAKKHSKQELSKEPGAAHHRWTGYRIPKGQHPPVVEEEFTVRRKYAAKPKPWGKLHPLPKAVVDQKPHWTRAPTETPVKAEAPVKVDDSVEFVEAPVEVTEAPVEVTEAPVEVTEAPVEVTEAPVEVTEAPDEVTEATIERAQSPFGAPVAITKRPHPTLPTPSTMKYVLNHEAAKKYWATAKFPTTTPVAPQKLEAEAPLLSKGETVTEHSETNLGDEEPQKTKSSQFGPVIKEQPIPEKPIKQLISPGYVLNEKAAEEYWSTANFPKATPAYSQESLTEAPLLSEQVKPVGEQTEQQELHSSEAPKVEDLTVPEVDAVVPVEKLVSLEQTTQKYVSNKKEAEEYWATARFEATVAPALEPATEASEPIQYTQREEEQANPSVEPVLEEQKPVEDKPIEVVPPATTEYVLNEEAAADYWATAKIGAATAPSVAETEAPEEISQEEPVSVPLQVLITEREPIENLPTAKPEQPEKVLGVEKETKKPTKKPLLPTVLRGKGLVVEKEEHKKYWIHKPSGHPKNIKRWHLAKPLKPCQQKKPTEKIVECQPGN